LYIGDDVTDVDAFRGLSQMLAEGRISRALRVGVGSDETPPEVVAQSDFVIDGTAGVAELLAELVAD
jgi:trehalose 6-phosphate phosphatase